MIVKNCFIDTRCCLRFDLRYVHVINILVMSPSEAVQLESLHALVCCIQWLVRVSDLYKQLNIFAWMIAVLMAWPEVNVVQSIGGSIFKGMY